jgi:hypothetical protein
MGRDKIKAGAQHVAPLLSDFEKSELLTRSQLSVILPLLRKEKAN